MPNTNTEILIPPNSTSHVVRKCVVCKNARNYCLGSNCGLWNFNCITCLVFVRSPMSMVKHTIVLRTSCHASYHSRVFQNGLTPRCVLCWYVCYLSHWLSTWRRWHYSHASCAPAGSPNPICLLKDRDWGKKVCTYTNFSASSMWMYMGNRGHTWYNKHISLLYWWQVFAHSMWDKQCSCSVACS